jgi:hypothetical protein
MLVLARTDCGHSYHYKALWIAIVVLLLCVASLSVEAAPAPVIEFVSSSFHHVQLNLSLYDEEKRTFVMDMWRQPNHAVENFLRQDPDDADWEYRSEYVSILLQGHRTLQAYQTQRFVLQEDVLTEVAFEESFTTAHVETAISVTLSYVTEMISTMADVNDICFFGDVSFQHIFQFSQGCPACTLRYYSATAAGHASSHQDLVERLLNFMRDPSLLKADTIGKYE